jgi:hypothetical protein
MKHFAMLVIFAAVTMVTGGVLVGAPEKQSTSDRPLRRMAEFAVGELGSEYELVRVVSGTKQVFIKIIYMYLFGWGFLCVLFTFLFLKTGHLDDYPNKIIFYFFLFFIFYFFLGGGVNLFRTYINI